MAWNERDDSTPAALLRYTWDFLADRPGHRFELRSWSEGEFHHDRARIQWWLCDVDGPILLEGADVAELDDDRITRVTGFFPVD